MTRSEHYCAGKTHGERWAEHDLSDGLGVQHATLADMNYATRWTLDESERAYAIGLRRGYRQVVRTLRGGRWGT